ncbi:MAG: hypothetical protein AAF639_35380 [Chloroflexota bacterium]
MNRLDRMMEEIKRGENIDLYSAVFLAVILNLLNFVYTVPDNFIIPLNMLILALISMSLLGNRHRIDELREQTKMQKDVFMTEFPKDLNNTLKNSDEFFIIGVDLNDTLKKNYALIIECIKQHTNVKCILLNPMSEACTSATKLHLEPINVDTKRL